MRKHFTLIELLIVIAVIAILAGLLLPALGRGKDLATQAFCTGNVRQIATAVLAYGSDFNDRCIWAAYSQNGTSSRHSYWPYSRYFLENNMLTKKVMVCPAFPQAASSINFWNQHYDVNPRLGGETLVHNGVGYNAIISEQFSRVQTPSQCLLVSEVSRMNAGSLKNDLASVSWRDPQYLEQFHLGISCATRAALRHNNYTSSPVAYVDGHCAKTVWNIPVTAWTNRWDTARSLVSKFWGGMGWDKKSYMGTYGTYLPRQIK